MIPTSARVLVSNKLWGYVCRNIQSQKNQRFQYSQSVPVRHNHVVCLRKVWSASNIKNLTLSVPKHPLLTCSCKVTTNTSFKPTVTGRNIQYSTHTNSNIKSQLAHLSVEKMAAARGKAKLNEGGITNIGLQSQNYEFFLVLDFEATCDDQHPPQPQEIIEFPVLKVNAKTLAVDSTFHTYVRPTHHPRLTPFCTQLTGIVQDMVADQPTFPEVMKSFREWMLSEGLLEPETKSIFVTCGDWDLKSMLPRQCSTCGVNPDSYFKRWINIKKSYADVTRMFPKGMMHMLTGLDLSHQGRHHSGIDDCRNIANIVQALVKQGYVFKENGRLHTGQ